VHDAASVFRRYLNMLPVGHRPESAPSLLIAGMQEPVIPYELYAAFRDALRMSQLLLNLCAS
jgi:hypothetical protein